MSEISTLLVIGAVIVWIIYATFRIAPSVEQRWNVWGELIAYTIFAAVVVIIEWILFKF